MTKEMSIEEFGTPLACAEADLQGKFDKAFVARLHGRYRTVAPALWRRTCELVGMLPKTARIVVARDFADQYLKAMNEAEVERKRREREAEAERGGEPMPLVSHRHLLELMVQHGPWGVKKDAQKRLEELDEQEARERAGEERSGS